MIPPKRFDISPLDWGMLRRSRRIHIYIYILLENDCFTKSCINGNVQVARASRSPSDVSTLVENTALRLLAEGRAETGVWKRGVMYCHTYSKSMDQPGKVANPPRGQLNGED